MLITLLLITLAFAFCFQFLLIALYLSNKTENYFRSLLGAFIINTVLMVLLSIMAITHPDDIYSVKARLLDSTFAAILKGSDVEAKLLTLYCVNDLGTLYLPRVRLGLFDLLADKSDAIRMPTLRALNEIVTAADFAKLKNVYLFKINILNSKSYLFTLNLVTPSLMKDTI